MKIIIAADDAAKDFCNSLFQYLKEKGYNIDNYNDTLKGTELYPDIAYGATKLVANNTYNRGVLICGTGLGMAITANKVPGIRAALCSDIYSTKRAVLSNNAQIMTLGARVIGLELAKELVEAFLSTNFNPKCRSTPKIERITAVENSIQRKE